MEKNITNKTNANGITELVFILDRSGSMSGLEKDNKSGGQSPMKHLNQTSLQKKALPWFQYLIYDIKHIKFQPHLLCQKTVGGSCKQVSKQQSKQTSIEEQYRTEIYKRSNKRIVEIR